MKHDVDDSLIYLTADILIQIIQIRWMWGDTKCWCNWKTTGQA